MPHARLICEIDAVGPGGSHLGRDNTRQHHRDIWQPRLFDRSAYERRRAAGATTLRERVAAQTRALREAPLIFRLEKSVRERLSAALAAAGAEAR